MAAAITIRNLQSVFLIVALADTILPDREVQEEQMVDKAKIEQAIAKWKNRIRYFYR